jgi:hypothetical protein
MNALIKVIINKTKRDTKALMWATSRPQLNKYNDKKFYTNKWFEPQET